MYYTVYMMKRIRAESYFGAIRILQNRSFVKQAARNPDPLFPFKHPRGTRLALRELDGIMGCH
jgi:hypothetical protein